MRWQRPKRPVSYARLASGEGAVSLRKTHTTRFAAVRTPFWRPRRVRRPVSGGGKVFPLESDKG